MNIFKKLQSVRVELHGMKLEKTGKNNGKLFFEMGDFLPSAIVLFEKHGLCGVCSFTPEFATLTIHSTDDDAPPIVITSPFGSCDLKAMHVVQNIGATVTYQRRYLWMTALDIIEHDGIDATAFDEFDIAPYVTQMESAKTLVELNAAHKALVVAANGALDKATEKAVAQKKNELAKALAALEPLSEERFTAALAALDAGKTTKDKLTQYALTAEQLHILESRPWTHH